MIRHGFLSSLRRRLRDDASYCARCGEPLREGVPRIIYHRRRGENEEKAEKQEKQEKDEFDEKTDAASRNGIALFIVWNVLKARERCPRPY